LINFPNAKINLGLQVHNKRPDGYHNIATVFYPIACNDVLEIIRADEFSFSSSGLTIDVGFDKNLCYKAWSLLAADFQLAAVKIHLHKLIPMGAGLGGGSADGAATLLMLNQLFNLALNNEKLAGYAAQLGSDCAFFVFNTPMYATGRGEILEPITMPQLEHKKIMLVNSGLHIHTGWAFGQASPGIDQPDLTRLIQLPIEDWKDKLVNDFEAPVFAAYPQLADIKKKLYASGAEYAAMTGSGSTIFGIFNQSPAGHQQWFDASVQTILV
jgi:4-diphosphocytidyl-2-C-methyl-D-erythritol kinase